MKLFDKEQIVEAFSTFWANIATLFGRNNGLATLNSKGKIPLSQIDDSLFNDHIEYVDTVPTEDIKNKIYAVPHSYTTNENKETNTLDIIGSYTTIQSNGKYVVDDNVVLSLDGVTIGSMFVSGTTVNLYTGKDFTGMLARTVTTSAINVWNVKQTVNHRDYYCGNEDAQTVTKMANVDQVEDWFIRKEQKGAPGGVAILNADGKIPVDELSFNTLVFMGLSSNLATDIAEISELASGMFFIANAEQVYNEVTYYPGDWCIWDGTSWSRQANVNVVSSVNDKVGNVMLTGDDIPVTYEGEEDTLNNTLPKLGKVKTVNGNGPDSNGNITIEFTSDDIANESDYPGDTVTEVLNSYITLINSKANAASLATVATSGSYNDLTDKPTVPTKTSELTNDSNFISTNDDWLTIDKTNGGVLLQKDGVETARFRSKDGTISTPALKTYSDKHTNLYGSLNILGNNKIRMYYGNDSKDDAYLTLSEAGIYLDNHGFAVDNNSIRYNGVFQADSDGTAWLGGDSHIVTHNQDIRLSATDAIHLYNDYGSSIHVEGSVNIHGYYNTRLSADNTVEIDAGDSCSVKFQHGRVQINEYGSLELRGAYSSDVLAEINQYGTGRFQKLEIGGVGANSDGDLSAINIYARNNMYVGGKRVLTTANFSFDASTGTLDITI